MDLLFLLLTVPLLVFVAVRIARAESSVSQPGRSPQAQASSKGKAVAVSVVCFMLALSIICFFVVLGNFPPDSSDSGTLWTFWILAPMAAVAAAGQLIFIITIANQWELLSRAERDSLVAKAVFLPPVIALGSFITAAIGAIALVVWFFASGGTGPYGGIAGNGSGAGVGGDDVTDGYGNRIGSVSHRNGEITDRYGSRVGWIKRNGEVTDRYGNRKGWIK